MSDSVTPWTVAHQTPLSMGFSRQEYWSGLPFPSPGDLLHPGIKPRSPALQADFSIRLTSLHMIISSSIHYFILLIICLLTWQVVIDLVKWRICMLLCPPSVPTQGLNPHLLGSTCGSSGARVGEGAEGLPWTLRPLFQSYKMSEVVALGGMSVQMSYSAVGKLRERQTGKLETQSQQLASVAMAARVSGVQGLESQTWCTAPSLCPEVSKGLTDGRFCGLVHCGDFLWANQSNLTNHIIANSRNYSDSSNIL